MLALHAARKASVNIRKLPGTHRIIDVVRRLSYRMGSVTIADFDEDLIITLDLSEHMASQIFWFGYYSRDVAVLLKDYLPAGGIFLDGGANIGELTLLAAKRVGAAGRVISFEPVEEIRKKLIQHIDWNKFGSIVSVREQGLSDQIGTHLMYGATTSYGDGSQHSGLGTIFPTDTRGSELGMIALTTIDRTVKDLNLTRLDGIKLDIEGAELAAIRGGAEAIQRFKPWLIVEIGQDTCQAAGYEPADVLAALSDYTFYRIARHGRLAPITANDLLPWQNVMCLPKVPNG